MEHCDFICDTEKMIDFFTLTSDEFLSSYSYLDAEDYFATSDRIMELFGLEPTKQLRYGQALKSTLIAIILTDLVQKKDLDDRRTA